MNKTPSTGTLYQELSSDANFNAAAEIPQQQLDQHFRLQEISRLRKHLEDEKEKHSRLYKKYQRGVNVVSAIDTALLTASMLMGIGGVSLLSTIIAAPVVMGLEAAALGCGLLNIAGKFVTRRLSVKAKKHNEIMVLAGSKHSSIIDHVSNALTDGQISDEEFHIIVEEARKYYQMKAKIRALARKEHAAVTLDEEAKNSLIQHGINKVRAKFIRKQTAP